MNTTFKNLIAAAALGLSAVEAHATTMFTDTFDQPDGLITNEFAYYNPANPSAVKSPRWYVTSGSMFASGGAAWSGVPDTVGPDAQSTNGTNSAIFRATTLRRDFGNVEVHFRLFNAGLNTSSLTPAKDWDGLHIFLRYQHEAHLYYASLNRRDNTVIIKKKVPGGPSNGGTYYNISSYRQYTVPYNAWQTVKASIKTNDNGSVTIELWAGGNLLVSATDNGVGGPPILAPGGVGFRGDNANLKFEDFSVTDLGGVTQEPDAAALAKAPQKFLSPALADGVNDYAQFGIEAREVAIYDLKGQEVFRAARNGQNPIVWTGRDHGGSIVDSGVYIAKIVNDDAKRLYQSFAIVK